MIGLLGTVVFEVSSDYVKTFDDFSRETHARYAKHDVLGVKPIKQFLGPDLDKIKFKIKLSAAFGVNPAQEIKTLRSYMTKGEAVTLVVGNKSLGKYTIESINEAWTVIDNKGNIVTAEIDIELEEYITTIPKIIRKIQKKNTKVNITKKVNATKKVKKKNVVKKSKKVVSKPKVTRMAILGTKIGGYTPI